MTTFYKKVTFKIVKKYTLASLCFNPKILLLREQWLVIHRFVNQ